MQTQNKFFDDMAKLATGAVGAAHSVKGEMEGHFRAWLDRQLSTLDLVTREEFETVRLMAEKARRENEDLRLEIDALKAKLEQK
jgi:BMFP domain-containing protein YqiC